MSDLEARVVASADDSSTDEDIFDAQLGIGAGRGAARWPVILLGCAALIGAGVAASAGGGASGVGGAGGAGGAVLGATRGEIGSVVSFSSVSEAEITGSQNTGLLPRETKGDGNSCADDEELHMGLCYDKCSILTGGEFGVRQSAWTCCKSSTCSKNPFAMFSCCKHNMGFCSGYDIAGMMEGQKVCPHKPGACLTDEELFLGMCYKSCMLLTDNSFPYRVGPASCCKRSDATCVIEKGAKDGLHGESLTDSNFNVGGGCSDGKGLTQCEPHLPQASLAE